MEIRTPFRQIGDEEALSPSGKEPSPRDKVFRFLPRQEVTIESASAPTERRRDWSAAIDLVQEAAEMIRQAEDRVQAAEDYAKQLSDFHKDQIRDAEARVTAAERRAELASLRAAEAEAWLAKLHDAITDRFGTVKPGA